MQELVLPFLEQAGFRRNVRGRGIKGKALAMQGEPGTWILLD